MEKVEVGIAHWAITAKKGNDGKGSKAMMEGSLADSSGNLGLHCGFGSNPR